MSDIEAIVQAASVLSRLPVIDAHDLLPHELKLQETLRVLTQSLEAIQQHSRLKGDDISSSPHSTPETVDAPTSDHTEIDEDVRSLIQALSDREQSISECLSSSSCIDDFSSRWTEEDPRINDIKFCSGNRSLPASFHRGLGQRSLADEYDKWEQKNYNTSRISELCKGLSAADDKNGHMSEFVKANPYRFKDENSATHGIKHGIRLLVFERTYEYSGVSALLIPVYSLFRKVKYANYPSLKRLLEKVPRLNKLAEEKCSWLMNCQERYNDRIERWSEGRSMVEGLRMGTDLNPLPNLIGQIPFGSSLRNNSTRHNLENPFQNSFSRFSGTDYAYSALISREGGIQTQLPVQPTSPAHEMPTRRIQSFQSEPRADIQYAYSLYAASSRSSITSDVAAIEADDLSSDASSSTDFTEEDDMERPNPKCQGLSDRRQHLETNSATSAEEITSDNRNLGSADLSETSSSYDPPRTDNSGATVHILSQISHDSDTESARYHSSDPSSVASDPPDDEGFPQPPLKRPRLDHKSARPDCFQTTVSQHDPSLGTPQGLDVAANCTHRLEEYGRDGSQLLNNDPRLIHARTSLRTADIESPYTQSIPGVSDIPLDLLNFSMPQALNSTTDSTHYIQLMPSASDIPLDLLNYSMPQALTTDSAHYIQLMPSASDIPLDLLNYSTPQAPNTTTDSAHYVQSIPGASDIPLDLINYSQSTSQNLNTQMGSTQSWSFGHPVAPINY